MYTEQDVVCLPHHLGLQCFISAYIRQQESGHRDSLKHLQGHRLLLGAAGELWTQSQSPLPAICFVRSSDGGL